MARIDYTKKADADLRDIWLYIAYNNAPSVSDAVLARIFDAMETLSFAPLIGRLRTDLKGQPRSFAGRPYTIIYKPLPMRMAFSSGMYCTMRAICSGLLSRRRK